MIGVRTPFRLSFVGGGSDVRGFYRQRPGRVVSTTLNKYMFLFVNRYFDERIHVKYSRTEIVDRVEEIRHPLVRHALLKFRLRGLDINSIADVPAGSGLGSSSAFTVGLLHALYTFQGVHVSKERLAREACELEIDQVGDPIGKQDQYAAAYGGLNKITFHPNEEVDVEPVVTSRETRRHFRRSLMMFNLGITRTAGTILADVNRNIGSSRERFDQVVRMVELADQFAAALTAGNLDDCGSILDEAWHLKRGLSKMISSDQIEHYYRLARQNGARGGKVCGAGGGGYMMFVCPPEDQEKLATALSDLRPLPIRFDRAGTRLVYFDDAPGDDE